MSKVVRNPFDKSTLGFMLHDSTLCSKAERGVHDGDLVLFNDTPPKKLMVTDGYLVEIEVTEDVFQFFVCSPGLFSSRKITVEGETEVSFILRQADNLEVISTMGQEKK